MKGFRRVIALTVRFHWAAKAKFVLLAALTAVGMTVLLLVTELSRVSSQDLDAAIADEVGAAGTYVIDLASDLGLESTELADLMTDAFAPYVAGPTVMIDVLPAIEPECPPYAELGPLPILVMRDAGGRPVNDLPFGRELPLATQFCFDGHEIPASGILLPDRTEQVQWGTGVFIDSMYEHLATFSTSEPITYRFSLVTGRQVDERDEIERSIHRHLEHAANRHGVDVSHEVLVRRADAGDGIRSASEGIKLVYAVIGWGVLALGGLGLLVSELIVVRERSWFFGLARAVGARSSQIAGLVLADVLLVLVAGTALAATVALVAQPVVSSFAQDAFGVDVHLLQASTGPKLLAGALMVLSLAGVYPALRAIHEDPLDVLEPRTG